jgi:hypothetical protein
MHFINILSPFSLKEMVFRMSIHLRGDKIKIKIRRRLSSKSNGVLRRQKIGRGEKLEDHTTEIKLNQHFEQTKW